LVETATRGTMASASGARGGNCGIEKRAGCRQRERNGVWAVIEGNRLLLLDRDLLNRDTSAASLAIDIRRVVINREGVFCTGLEDCRFDVADRSRARDISHVRRAPYVRLTGRDDLVRGLRGIN
jgi:hypothetical protein